MTYRLWHRGLGKYEGPTFYDWHQAFVYWQEVTMGSTIYEIQLIDDTSSNP